MRYALCSIKLVQQRSYMQSDYGKGLFLTLKEALEQGMIGDDNDFSGKVCVKRKDTEFERQVRSESLIPPGDAIHAQVNRQQPYRGGGSSPRATEKSTNTPESADSLLSHVEVTGDVDFKDHNDGNHFLAREIDSRVAARTYLERKKQGSAASTVQLEAQHAPEVNTADSNIVHCCSQNYLTLPW